MFRCGLFGSKSAFPNNQGTAPLYQLKSNGQNMVSNSAA